MDLLSTQLQEYLDSNCHDSCKISDDDVAEFSGSLFEDIISADDEEGKVCEATCKKGSGDERAHSESIRDIQLWLDNIGAFETKEILTPCKGM
jgi:hypothetical protein